MSPIILLADDHIMLTIGLIGYLQGKLGYRQIYAVASCNGILKELKRTPYTHLVLDIALADGSAFEILETLNNLYPKLRILLFSSKPAETYEKALRKFKIECYLSKDANEEESLELLRRFLQNETIPSRLPKDQNPFSNLTARELEILHYLVKGARSSWTPTSRVSKSTNSSAVRKRYPRRRLAIMLSFKLRRYSLQF